VPPYDLGRQRAGGQEPLFAVEVVQQEPEQSGALFQSLLDAAPFLGSQDDGERVDGPASGVAAAVEDALIAHQRTHLRARGQHSAEPELLDGLGEKPLVSAHSGRSEQLVPAAGQAGAVADEFARHGRVSCHRFTLPRPRKLLNEVSGARLARGRDGQMIAAGDS